MTLSDNAENPAFYLNKAVIFWRDTLMRTQEHKKAKPKPHQVLYDRSAYVADFGGPTHTLCTCPQYTWGDCPACEKIKKLHNKWLLERRALMRQVHKAEKQLLREAAKLVVPHPVSENEKHVTAAEPGTLTKVTNFS